MYQGKQFQVNDFSGGYCGNIPPSALKQNEALDLDNITLALGGKTFRVRDGFTAQGYPDATNNVTSLGVLNTSTGTNYLLATAGTKIYTNQPSVNSTWTDRTGAVTITSGSYWNFVPFNDLAIGFGSNVSGAIDAPIKCAGGTNAVALGGTPPSAAGCFTANNRVFAFNTVAAPSTIYWSVLGNAEDWTSTGSGSAVVGSLADGQPINAAAVIGTNTALIFKSDSIHQMVLTSAPFPIYPLFNGVGCVGKHAAVEVNGKVYFITNRKRMMATDGENLESFTNKADDVWDSIAVSDLATIKGFRVTATDHDWIVWQVKASGNAAGNSSTGLIAIIWDLINKCWLRHTTGWDLTFSNIVRNRADNKYYVGTTAGAGTVNGGGITFNKGGVYQLDVPSRTYDQLRADPGIIAGYWLTGWTNYGSPDQIVEIKRMTFQMLTFASTFTVSYGYDFVSDIRTFTVDQTATASETATSRYYNLTGRGNFFQFRIRMSTSQTTPQDMRVYGITLSGKEYGQKRISVS